MVFTGVRPVSFIVGRTGRRAGRLFWITPEDYTLNQARRNNSLHSGEKPLFIEWPWTGVHSSNAHLINHLDLQIIVHPNLTRKANVIRQFGFHSQTIALELSHFTGIAGQHFDAARRAARVAATAVKYIDSGVLQNQH